MLRAISHPAYDPRSNSMVACGMGASDPRFCASGQPTSWCEPDHSDLGSHRQTGAPGTAQVLRPCASVTRQDSISTSCIIARVTCAGDRRMAQEEGCRLGSTRRKTGLLRSDKLARARFLGLCREFARRLRQPTRQVRQQAEARLAGAEGKQRGMAGHPVDQFHGELVVAWFQGTGWMKSLPRHFVNPWERRGEAGSMVHRSGLKGRFTARGHCFEPSLPCLQARGAGEGLPSVQEGRPGTWEQA